MDTAHQMDSFAMVDDNGNSKIVNADTAVHDINDSISPGYFSCTQ